MDLGTGKRWTEPSSIIVRLKLHRGGLYSVGHVRSAVLKRFTRPSGACCGVIRCRQGGLGAWGRGGVLCCG